MTWGVKLVPRVEKWLEKQPKDIIVRIVSKLELIKDSPFVYLEHYEGEGYKLRIGDYRAIIDADYANKILKVRVIEHRKKVYKKHS